MSSICESLKFLREQRGMSINGMAESLRMSKSTYASYEYGAREPNYDILCKLADYFGVTTDYLLGRSQPDMPVLSQEESDLVESYRDMSDAHREVLKSVAGVISEAEKL